jgi:hypothetical protein
MTGFPRNREPGRITAQGLRDWLRAPQTVTLPGWVWAVAAAGVMALLALAAD